MPRAAAPVDPPPITGARRSHVDTRGVRFHVTEAGSGTPVLVLHGWPQHHYCYRDLLADPPPGMRIIAPDLPGYGWSGPPPHRWEKEQVAQDVLALLDALSVQKTLLVGHDWGGWISYLMLLAAPERFTGLLALGIPHPWNGPKQLLPHLWRLGHMPLMATAGRPLVTRTSVLSNLIFRLGIGDHTTFPARDVHWFSDRFRDPVCARVTQETYRTFLTKEILAGARSPELRRTAVPIRALLGTHDFAIHRDLLSPRAALADDYTLEMVPGCGHFIADERPALVRERLISLAAA